MQFVFIGGRAATIEYQGGADASPGGSSAQSATAVPYGAADTQRRVVQIVHWIDNPTLTAATIGGVAATIHVQNKEATVGLGVASLAIISAALPSGTSGTTALTWSGNAGSGTRVESFRAVGIIDPVPVTAIANLGLSAGNSKTVEIDVKANGFAIAGMSGKSDGSVTITGLTERYEVVKFSDRLFVGGSDNISATEASHDITFSYDSQGGAMVAAAFR